MQHSFRFPDGSQQLNVRLPHRRFSALPRHEAQNQICKDFQICGQCPLSKCVFQRASPATVLVSTETPVQCLVLKPVLRGVDVVEAVSLFITHKLQ